MAAALVGGAFLSATLQVLFDRMASREVLDFFRRRKLDDGLLKKLEITLVAVNAVLDDAEEKQITNPAVKKWLDELKDAVYNAEDLLDQIATEALQSELETGSQNFISQVRGFISSSLNPFDKGITSKVKKIIENIEYIVKQKELLGLREGVGRKPSQSLPTTSLVDESGVYGREADKEEISKLLLSEDATDNGTCVITIVGLGGVGKTTLTQLLYNDEKVKEYFDLKAWVCVSEEFDVLRVTKTVLESVSPQTNASDDHNLLQVKLKESLMGKKFLIVLDDIWNDNYDDWDKLRTLFGVGDKGSKIIVTTRHESVASIMRTVPTHYLGKISDEASWSLFEKHAFGNENPNAHPNKAIIGKKIVEKCKGLPLAIKTLGGLLRSKPNAKEWNDILKSNIWEIPNDKILPALRLSYHHLPTHLKRCFAYCSIFPKDYTFKKEMLVLLWMAEGFVQQLKSDKRMEEVGDEYFRELSSRSFFQQSGGEKSGFVMHDLINDLAQFVSGEFCYMLEGNKSHQISRKVRHFSYLMEHYDSHKKLGPFCEIKCLRTFLPFMPLLGYLPFSKLTNKVLNDLLTTLSCLRVLSLSQYENIIELPDSIGNLKQLRYLDLSRTKIEGLPDVICNLCNLQTLMLSKCSSLSVLPSNIGKLTNLRHLDTSGTNLTEMPIQMNGLKSLQTLTTFVVGKHAGLRVGELREFQHLQGRLSILKLQNVVNPMDAWEANLKEKEHLDELHLEWGCDTNDSHNERDVLDKLQPSTNLQRLTLKYYGGLHDYLTSLDKLNIISCPKFVSFPKGGLSTPNVTSFYVSDCINLKSLPENMRTLLPSLQELKIWFCPELESFPEGGLPSNLIQLQVRYCDKLTACRMDWGLHTLASLKHLEIGGCEEVDSFPEKWLLPSALTSLEISSIPNLKHLDKRGFQHLTSLQKLHIWDCPRLQSLPEEGLPASLYLLSIWNCPLVEQRCHREKGEEWPKIAHIPCIVIDGKLIS